MTNEAPKFLVDENLQRLARWLRAAGYDTVIAHGTEASYYLLRQAIDEGRLLLCMDNELAQHRSAQDTVILLEGDSIDEHARQISNSATINWTHKPFTRCLVCNSALGDAGRTLGDETESDDAYYCSHCNQVFWDDSHVNRMRSHLSEWHQKFNTN